MKVISIVITLESDEKDRPDHATAITFADGMWTANGPMYSRISGALHEIVKLLRGVRD